MIMVDDIEFNKAKEFAERAAEHFARNPAHWTYTDDEIEGGELFALCFGLDRQRVVVFRIDDMHNVYNFGDYAAGAAS